MNQKFIPVLIVYLILGAISWFSLIGTPRLAVLILLAGLAAKTMVARAANR